MWPQSFQGFATPIWTHLRLWSHVNNIKSLQCFTQELNTYVWPRWRNGRRYGADGAVTDLKKEMKWTLDVDNIHQLYVHVRQQFPTKLQTQTYFRFRLRMKLFYCTLCTIYQTFLTVFFLCHRYLVIPSSMANPLQRGKRKTLHLGLESFFPFLLNYDHVTLGERLNWVRLFTLWVGGLFKRLLPSSLCGGSAGGSFRVSLMDAAKAGSLKRLGGGHMTGGEQEGEGEGRKTRRERNLALRRVDWNAAERLGGGFHRRGGRSAGKHSES